ncbi:MAG TPA: hypothetical protein VI248_23145 [Kineosporiaceae bacterium]
MNRRRRILASTGAAVLLTGGAAAESAQAWPWSATVTVTGTAGCTQLGGALAITGRATLDGQTFQNTVLTNNNRYSVTLTNVRASGSPRAWMQITCAAPDGHVSQGWTDMYRPAVGSTITRNF